MIDKATLQSIVDDEEYSAQITPLFLQDITSELLALRKLAEDMAKTLEDTSIWSSTILSLYPDHPRDGGNVRDDVANTQSVLASYREEYPKEGQ